MKALNILEDKYGFSIYNFGTEQAYYLLAVVRAFEEV